MKLENILNAESDNIVSDAIVFEYMDKMLEGKSSKSPIDIGDGFYARRVGYDVNGNWSYWVARGNRRFEKIQATNVNGGKNKITDMSNFVDPEYTETVNGIKEYYNKYIKSLSLNREIGESVEPDSNFHIELSESDIVNIPDTFSYKIQNITIETPQGTVNVPDAGILSLNMDQIELARKLVETTGDDITKVNNIVIKQPPTDITFSGPFAVSGAYTVLVTYTTGTGNEKQMEVNFNDLNFSQSDSFLQFFQNLT